MSSLLNRKAVKQLALDVASRRAHRFTRVSKEFLEQVEGELKTLVTTKVNSLPSVGMTIK